MDVNTFFKLAEAYMKENYGSEDVLKEMSNTSEIHTKLTTMGCKYLSDNISNKPKEIVQIKKYVTAYINSIRS